MRHDSPATVKGSRHVCKTAGCRDTSRLKPEEYRAYIRENVTKPAKARPFLGSSVPKGNVRVKTGGVPMKVVPRSERQERRVALAALNKQRNEEYYQATGSGAPWKSGRG